MPPENVESLSFEEVYSQHGKKILNLALRLTGNETDARDLTQEVFIKVYENLDSFNQQSDIYTWIYRIAVNHTLNHLKKIRRTRWLHILDENIMDVLSDKQVDPAFIPNSASHSPHQLMENAERDRIVKDAVDSLPPKYQIPFILYRFEELSYQEIASALSLSLSAVEARIHRAKKQLIKKLEPWLKDL